LSKHTNVILCMILFISLFNFLLLVNLKYPQYFQEFSAHKTQIKEVFLTWLCLCLAFFPMIVVGLFWEALHISPLGNLLSCGFIPAFLYFFECIAVNRNNDPIFGILEFLEESGIFLRIEYPIFESSVELLKYIAKWDVIYLTISICGPLLIFSLASLIEYLQEGKKESEKDGE